MDFLLGRKAKCYYNSNNVKVASPGGTTQWTSWLQDADTVEATNIMDLTAPLDSDFADVTTRGTAAGGFSASIPVLKTGSITFESLWLAETPGVSAPDLPFSKVLTDAWENFANISLAFLDQTKNMNEIPSGTSIRTRGLVANFYVSLSKGEAIRDAQKMNVTLTVADSAIWHELTVANP